MILYHFTTSPFARRVRLALASKGLTAELRDARGNAEHRAELQRLNPLHTVPVLVDGERVVVDSAAIGHYLDRKVPDPPLFPAGLAGAEAFELVAMCDSIITINVDLGMRYWALHDHAAFPAVRDEYIGRVQRSLDGLSRRVAAVAPGAFLFESRFTAADIAVYTTVAWLEGLPARVATFPPAKQMLSLGWSVPPGLSAWARPLRDRADVRALD